MNHRFKKERPGRMESRIVIPVLLNLLEEKGKESSSLIVVENGVFLLLVLLPFSLQLTMIEP